MKKLTSSPGQYLATVFTILIHEPASIMTPLIVLVLSICLDCGWKRSRANQAVPYKSRSGT